MDNLLNNDVEAGIPSGRSEENQNIDPVNGAPVVTVENEDDLKEVISSSPQEFTQSVIITEVVSEIHEEANTSVSVLLEKKQKVENTKKRFYPGDVVVVKEDRNLAEWQPFFGTVLKPTNGSDMAKSEDKGSFDEFHVHWDSTNRITQVKAKEVSVVDRCLFRGQKVENRAGDSGTVLGFETTVSVQISGSNEVVENVPIQRLRPISPHVRGQEILLNGWVGVITGIRKNVWFRVDGGPLFYLEAFERDGFTRTDPFWGLGVACPGMRTRLNSIVLKRAKWASSTTRFFSKLIPLHYLYAWAFTTIIRTEITELEIKWLTPAPGIPNSESLPVPPEILARDNLRKLLIVGTPSIETIGIGSVRKISIQSKDEISDHRVWLESFKKRFIDGLPFQYPKIRACDTALRDMIGNADQETPVKVLLRNNTVTVEWEDGKVEKVSAIDIPKISTVADEGEFPAGLTVAHVQKDTSTGDRYGIVMESSELAKSRSRKVNIRWIVDGKDDGVREESVFDIKPHTKYSMYHRGTILFPRYSSACGFQSAVVTDVNIVEGKMIVLRSSDNHQDEVFPHQVIALAKRCHWSFFTRRWTVDDMIPPPYQLEFEYDPANRLVDVTEQRLDVLATIDENNPQESTENSTTLWDEPPFELLGFAPQSHRYYQTSSTETFGKAFALTVEKEMAFLQSRENVTEGIWIRSYENRMDLLSVLMLGPSKTPYEDGLFLFDIRLPADFPSSVPAVHFVSYTLEIHPLLSYDGNVCVSTIPWNFTEENVEAPSSYIMFFITKLQEMLFTPAPYFASPQKKSEQNTENGRIKSLLYNQGVFVRVLDSIWNMLQHPHEPWEKSIHNHFVSCLPEKLQGIEKWINGETSEACYDYEEDFPSYPSSLMPEGLQMALKSRIESFKKILKGIPNVEISSVTDTTADSESHSVDQQEAAAAAAAVSAADDPNRRLTPIAEITEPSSTSTFGTKLSNLSVSSQDQDDESKENPLSFNLDSLKNIKQKKADEEKPTAQIIEMTAAQAIVGSEKERDEITTLDLD